MTTNCKYCGKEIEYTPIEGIAFSLKPTVCNACGEEKRKTEAAKVETARFEKWKTICPPIYQDTDLSHPSMPTPEHQAKILNWKWSGRGLIVRGKTRKCKTRLVWVLMKRLIVEGCSVKAISSTQFANECASSYGQGGDAILSWKDEMTRPSVLFIDDFGKFKLTDRVEAELFDVIEQRTSNGLPLIITTNYATGDEMAASLSIDRGPAIISRLREFCEAITLP